LIGDENAQDFDRTAVYRFYDRDGNLLYLGMTFDIDQRFNHHRYTQGWWLEVARKEVTWYDTRREARDIEVAATLTEKPRYDRAPLAGRTARTSYFAKSTDQRKEKEVQAARNAMLRDLNAGIYGEGDILPTLDALSDRYGLAVAGIAGGLDRISERDHAVVRVQDRKFLVTDPRNFPRQATRRHGATYTLAYFYFKLSPFTVSELAERLGTGASYLRSKLLKLERSGLAVTLDEPEIPLRRYQLTKAPEKDIATAYEPFQWHRRMGRWLQAQFDVDVAEAEEICSHAVNQVRKVQQRDLQLIAYLTTSNPHTWAAKRAILLEMARPYADRPGYEEVCKDG
jgi:hypothetical protein